jgi:Mce-associated membrane protein
MAKSDGALSTALIETEATKSERRRFSRPQSRSTGSAAALVVAVIAVVLIAMMAIDHHKHRDRRVDERELVEGAKSAAQILISPNGANAEQSAAAILDRATGEWYDEFSKNQDAFAGVLAQSNTIAEGTVLAGGLEKRTSDGGATVLVAARSAVSNSAGADNEQRTWRLRVDVVNVDGVVKVSHVEVVP